MIHAFSPGVQELHHYNSAYMDSTWPDITVLHMEWQACYGLNYYNVCLNPVGHTMHYYNYYDVCIHSSWPSVAFSQYQYNYPETNNGGIIILYSLSTNACTCSFSRIRLRNPLHQSHWWLVYGLDNCGIRIGFSTEERAFSVLQNVPDLVSCPPNFCPRGIRSNFPGIKWLVNEVDCFCILNLCWG